jgi:hypothetical protein
MIPMTADVAIDKYDEMRITMDDDDTCRTLTGCTAMNRTLRAMQGNHISSHTSWVNSELR